MSLRLLLVTLMVAFSAIGFAQKVNNRWTFGNQSGLNFNVSPPTSVKGSQISSGRLYSTAISDTFGDLLFYTDGFTTWNRKNEIMPKTAGRWPWTESIMPLICPYPGNDSLYYIFGVSSGSYDHRLQAITINMKANDGMGGIFYPDIELDSTNYYERLVTDASIFVAGTNHCNRKDFWIVTYARGGLYSYLVNSSGIDKQPVITQVPAAVIPPALYAGRNIKFSPNGERMVMPLIAENKVIVFAFDNFTGRFANPIKLDPPKDHVLTDVEFSPDGNKLYISTIDYRGDPGGREYHMVGQMDLKLNSETAVENSYYCYNEAYPDEANWCTPHNCWVMDRTMTLGPDGKIYISMRDVTGTNRERTITVIEEPNEKGLQANYISDKISINEVYQSIKYNYIRSLSYSPEENGIQFKKNICADLPVNFNLLSTKVDSVRWNFGDPASGSQNFSNSLNPQHSYSAAGRYSVTAVIYDRCTTDTAYADVNILQDKTIKVPAHIKDSVVCTGTTLMLDGSTPGATSYLWGGGNINPVQKITISGDYQLEVRNLCSIDRKEFRITVGDCQCDVFVPNAFTPNNDGLNDQFRPIVKCAATDYIFSVYNRYGKLIYESEAAGDDGWRGTMGVEPASAGVYIWTLQYRNPNNKKIINQHGKVVLIR